MVVWVIVMFINGTTVSYENLGRFSNRYTCESVRRAHDVDADSRWVVRGPTACVAVVR